MEIFGSGAAGSVDGARTGRTRGGWWVWYPVIFGTFFLLFGLGFLVGAASVPVAGVGLGITGAIFVLVAAGSFAVAGWAWRDIHSGDSIEEPHAVPGDPSAALQNELRTTGLPGEATITSFSYVGGTSHDGSTLVELQLDVKTSVGGEVPIGTKSRVPLAMTDRLGPGATVPVVVSSTDPQKLIIEWTGLLAASSAAPPAATPPASPEPTAPTAPTTPAAGA